MQKDELLRVEELSVEFLARQKRQMIINRVSLSLRKGEILGIVGDSGSGKSMTALSIMGLLSKEAEIMQGKIIYQGKDLLKLSEKELREWKGKKMSMIFQEPRSSLNPVMKIGLQIEEMLSLHEGMKRKERTTRTLEMLIEVGLSDAEAIYQKYPHQLSGGMCQRVMIAIAMVCNPDFLIADEPTTALDEGIQDQILKLIVKMNQQYGTAIIVISHDIRVIQSICHRVLVMKQGEIIEEGTTKDLLSLQPTQNKRRAIVSTELEEKQKVLEVNHIDASYEERNKRFPYKAYQKKVLENISFSLYQGEILGLVGLSGGGKSTLAKVIVSLIQPTGGDINLFGNKPQMVFQDPYSSLNPAKKIRWILEEPMKIQGGFSKKERTTRMLEVLEQVGLEEIHLSRYVSQLSGGQRQRVGIACALMCRPRIIILDEPVSALDVKVQDKVLKLLLDLRKKYELSYLFISHDKNVLAQMCDRVIELQDGTLKCEG